jgi:hypothetical protein
LQLTFARSAKRHGISHERARYVVEHCGVPLYQPVRAGQHVVVMFLGLDQHGVPLEIAAVEAASEELIVIHAMRLRRKFRSDLERVIAAHDR